MSHLKERAEKNCLNCNAQLEGRYCHVCGQENLEPVETAWHLVTHFFNDITHFDGSFFSTLKYLIIKPGFLSREYKAGRRSAYLNPVRMYIFTSAIFFLIFFSVSHISEDSGNRIFNGRTLDQVKKMDTADFNAFTKELNNGKAMSQKQFQEYADSMAKGTIQFSGIQYKSKAAYDSLAKKGTVKDNWFEKQIAYKQIEIQEKYKDNPHQISQVFLNNLLHSFPQMLFISLPLFAFILKLLYFRRKDFYYAAHAIYSIHLYVFVFIMLVLVIAMRELKDYIHWSIFDYLTGAIVIYIFYYQFRSMRKFYLQRRAKTILKYLLLNITMFFIITLLLIVFFFFSLLKL